VHRRATAVLTHDHVRSQRRVALWLTVFAAVRTVAWLVAMMIIVAHWLGAGGSFVHGFIDVSSTVLFVTFISFYCNASTDAANLTAGLAALFSADSHHATTAARATLERDLAAVEDDILRLAALQPGTEAEDLARSIRARLKAEA
jgi:UDP-N-acetylmuramyl pentapeptide phosphotransferase/UDP-N-acetylglucosamine-1-phosphate transferase